MTMELSSIRVVRKPWGRTDLRPWSELGHDGATVGELWFQRADKLAPEPALLLKLLFTDEPLSIQVHPDNDFARAIGLPHGKTEAWHVLSATAGAKVALGLKRELTRPQLRAAIEDGSIAELVHWQDVAVGETLLVPAGTIHANDDAGSLDAEVLAGLGEPAHGERRCLGHRGVAGDGMLARPQTHSAMVHAAGGKLLLASLPSRIAGCCGGGCAPPRGRQ